MCKDKTEDGEKTPDWNDVTENAPEADAAAEKTEPSEQAGPAPEPTPEEKLAAELAQLQSKYLYLQAEYQNYRKRVAKDLADARAFTVADTLAPFLSVFDYLTMAENAAENTDNLEAVRQGLKMIMGEFFKAFDEIGVKKFESVGKKFDPSLHDAVANEPSETVPEGQIIREWSGGFKLGEKLLRPARVVVSAGKKAPETEETSGENAEKDNGEQEGTVNGD